MNTTDRPGLPSHAAVPTAWVPSDLALRAPSLLASAGVLICVSQVWHLMAPLTPDQVNGWSYGVMSWTQLVSYAVLLLGVIALYGHGGPRAVRGRAVCFVVALSGTAGILGDVWFETVMVPMALPHSPDLLNAQPTPLWMIGILITFGLFSLGWVATAGVLRRSRLVGTPTAIALGAGGLLGFFVLTAPRGVPFGVSLVLVARALRRTPTRSTASLRTGSDRTTPPDTGDSSEGRGGSARRVLP